MIAILVMVILVAICLAPIVIFPVLRYPFRVVVVTSDSGYGERASATVKIMKRFETTTYASNGVTYGKVALSEPEFDKRLAEMVHDARIRAHSMSKGQSSSPLRPSNSRERVRKQKGVR